MIAVEFANRYNENSKTQKPEIYYDCLSCFWIDVFCLDGFDFFVPVFCCEEELNKHVKPINTNNGFCKKFYCEYAKASKKMLHRIFILVTKINIPTTIFKHMFLVLFENFNCG